VLPTVAEIIKIIQCIAPFPDQGVQTDLSFVLRRLFVIVFRYAIPGSDSVREFVQMRISPTHRQLKNGMKSGQLDAGWHGETPPNAGPDAAQGHVEREYQRDKH
jgi:hypothetical protein